MYRISRTDSILIALIIALTATVITARPASAHCDTMGGPVVKDAQLALETGHLTPVLKWVRAEDEAEVARAFEQSRTVRLESEAARVLADRFFFETVVRLHRESEGVAYTGLKPATAVDPAIAAADEALATGDLRPLATLLTDDLHRALHVAFDEASDAHARSDRGVAEGRQFVEAYVVFTHLAEEIKAATRHVLEGHGSEESAKPAAHSH